MNMTNDMVAMAMDEAAALYGSDDGSFTSAAFSQTFTALTGVFATTLDGHVVTAILSGRNDVVDLGHGYWRIIRVSKWIDLLLAIGIVSISRTSLSGVRWPLSWSWGMTKMQWRARDFAGLFRNKPGVVKWRRGRLLPRRWGFYLLRLEFGDRG